jgi:hypothetical protein
MAPAPDELARVQTAFAATAAMLCDRDAVRLTPDPLSSRSNLHRAVWRRDIPVVARMLPLLPGPAGDARLRDLATQLGRACSVAASSLSGRTLLPAAAVVPVAGGVLVLTLLAGGGSIREALPLLRVRPAIAVRVLADVAASLAVLHGGGVVHGSVRASTVLFGAPPPPLPQWPGVAMLADAGLWPLGDAAQTMATEGYAADMLAFGLLAVDLLVGPAGAADAADALVARMQLFAGLPPATAQMLGFCVARDAGVRPRAADVAQALAASVDRRAV